MIMAGTGHCGGRPQRGILRRASCVAWRFEPLADAGAARGAQGGSWGGGMILFRSLLIAMLALAGSTAAVLAGPTDPIEVGKLPYVEIFSPTFFWNDEADFVRVGSINCPKGRAITGGLNIAQGKASLRI